MKQNAHAKRRAASLLICVLLLLSLFAGCKSNSTRETTNPAAPSITDRAEEPSGTDPAVKPDDGPSAADVEVYTVKDLTPEDERVGAVVASCAGVELTNRQFPIYYWMQFISAMNNYGYYLGIDESKPLAEQPSLQEGMSWEQLFVASAVDQFHSYASIYAEAQKEGYQLTEDLEAQLTQTMQSLEENASSRGFDSADAYLQASFGGSVTKADYDAYLRFFYTVMSYEEAKYKAFSDGCTDEDLDAFYEAHKEEYADLSEGVKCIDVRHILVTPDDVEGDTEEEKQTAAKSLADEIYAEYLKESTEEKFSALAREYSSDPGSASSGGLYEGVREGDMVTEFNDWCFNVNRKPGDTDIVETQFGYHIMYFVGAGDYLRTTLRSDYLDNRMNTWINECVEANALTVDYAKIVLGEVKLTSDE